MIKTYRVLAIITNQSETQKAIYSFLQEHFDYLFEIIIYYQNALPEEIAAYDVIFSFKDDTYPIKTFLFSESADQAGYYLVPDSLKDSQKAYELARTLTQLYQQLTSNLQTYLQQFPSQMRMANAKGQILYHNHQFNGSFLPSDENHLETWIWQHLRKQGNLHLLLPFASLDHIYFQSYYGLQDENGCYVGSLDLVQDLKPILAQYLDETAQAIVGWSDVTSGPSISTDKPDYP
ncbi:hypothetical protein [Streptococcus halichoeri]|uniref:hypothetical protein n=1 Tax=Streptococcus halichoeri TaxID=254785 RepID=UPI001C8EB1B7|nr:hypothetical protein [Streptococcus halichoeri]